MTSTSERTEDHVSRRPPDDYFGASTVGPRHRSEGKRNEDSWLGARGAFGTLVVVSDGMGSRREARRGAQMACRAVLKAVRAWHKAGAHGLDELLVRIEPLWCSLIAPSIARDCAATCLFALAHVHGQVHVAAIGDGLALLRTQRGMEWVVGPRASGFANETDALGHSASWASRSFPRAGGDVVVLATDGVADDLLPERMNGFVQWLMDDFAGMAPSNRWRALQRELKDWPTPHHTDDKTLVVLAQREAVLA
ncbi:protein phosphatase 2C domain-containing protein [Corallococcus sp. AB011P]|uniref:protein phosphatase 2C domain-containing protein n=1 Tax=Corallococcus sp. AB011P TaxID=2316735 RepID=UPI000EA341E0|nr:protein phosphatase 2C domain-containing protein [Corallococcus sp. AB011P]RKG56898.1 protein phosphatase 2C domain-containing protein [Corallococcus sp. AB011P]